MHSLLKKQLRQLGIREGHCSDSQAEELFMLVSRTYSELEKEKKALHSLRKKYTFYFYYPQTERYELISEHLQKYGFTKDSFFANLKKYVIDLPILSQNIAKLREQLFATKESIHFEVGFYNADFSEVHYYEITEIPILNEKGEIELIEGIGKDITKLKREHHSMKYMLEHDILTGVLNRLGLHNALQRLLSFSKRIQKRFAVLFIDLDRFKSVNDTFGHEVGDKVLKAVAERLKSAVRTEDLVARLGGDEFVVVISNLDSRSDLYSVARKLHELFEQPLCFDDVSLHVSASIGVCLFPDDAEDIEALLRYADGAMYGVKKKGGANIGFCDKTASSSLSMPS